jgi:hypothetical protein
MVRPLWCVPYGASPIVSYILNDPRFAELLDEVGAVLEMEGDGLIAALQDAGQNT